MLREFKRALEAGDDDGAAPGALLDDGLTGSRDATSPTSHSSDVANDAHSTVDRNAFSAPALLGRRAGGVDAPDLGGSARAGREFGYGSTARERAAEADNARRRESPRRSGAMRELGAETGLCRLCCRRRGVPRPRERARAAAPRSKRRKTRNDTETQRLRRGARVVARRARGARTPRRVLQVAGGGGGRTREARTESRGVTRRRRRRRGGGL